VLHVIPKQKQNKNIAMVLTSTCSMNIKER
jgi:hypothetical protein